MLRLKVQKLSFVKSMATQLPKGMRINAIAPSLIEDTSMYYDMKKIDKIFTVKCLLQVNSSQKKTWQKFLMTSVSHTGVI